jgi:diketogulonate reductase-like aldo/keto reductase
MAGTPAEQGLRRLTRMEARHVNRPPDPAAPHVQTAGDGPPEAVARRRALWRMAAGLTAWTGSALADAVAAAPTDGLPSTAAQSPSKAAPDLLHKPVPSTGERLPVIGLGTWITFNVGADPVARASCAAVLRAFLDGGGQVVDSSPMYGSAQAVIGQALQSYRGPGQVYAADKVWTSSGERGPGQIESSRRHWGVPRFDLLQVHNLLAWEAHLPALMAMKSAGLVRHVGISTSEGRRHRAVEALMQAHPIDFVQVTYNPLDREVEQRILPLAAERAIGVIVNRPFRQGALLDALARHPLPDWARTELGCDGWAQYVLKFVVSHPAVTCAIPATRQVAHVRQNLGAARGPMPDDAMRRRMVRHVESL